MSITAWAAPRARCNLERFSNEAASQGPQGVEIRISHRGICHSDLHLLNSAWGSSRYPRVRVSRA